MRKKLPFALPRSFTRTEIFRACITIYINSDVIRDVLRRMTFYALICGGDATESCVLNKVEWRRIYHYSCFVCDITCEAALYFVEKNISCIFKKVLYFKVMKQLLELVLINKTRNDRTPKINVASEYLRWNYSEKLFEMLSFLKYFNQNFNIKLLE